MAILHTPSTAKLLVSVALITAVTAGARARKQEEENGEGPTPTGSAWSSVPTSEGVEWLSPSVGTAVQGGQTLTVIWRSDAPLYDPSFALCSSGGSSSASSANCGKESWPKVADNGDGTYSAPLTMPVISQAQMSGLFLALTDTDGYTYDSPPFSVQGGSGPGNAYIATTSQAGSVLTAGAASQWAPADETYALSSSTAAVGTSTYVAGSISGTVSAQAVVTKTMSRTATGRQTVATTVHVTHASSSYAASITAHSTLAQQNQVPLVATPFSALSNPSTSATQAQAQATYANALQATHPSPPKATAIALPLALCGLILLSALIFCARSKAFRKPGKSGDEEGGDWQAIVKDKAAASAACATASSQGVQVIERVEEKRPRETGQPRPQQARDSSYRSSHKSSSSSVRTDPRCRTPAKEERFTSVPEINYRQSRDKYSDPFVQRYESFARNSSRDSYDDYAERQGSKEDYYSTTRRSSGGLGGIYHSHRSTELYDRSMDDVTRRYKKEQSACAYHDEQLWRSRSGENRDADRCIGCEKHRRDSRDKFETASYYRPKPKQTDSFGPLTNPHEAIPRPPIRTRSTRPLPIPQPIIRTSSTPSSERYHRHLDSSEEYYPSHGYDSRHSKSRHTYAPHLTGALPNDPHDNAETDTEAGWELAGEGKYCTGDEGMDELYESLRRAIAKT